MNTSLGYAKKTLTNSNVLLSGGGDKALSEFIGSLNWDSTNKKLQYKSASSTDFTDLITFGSHAFDDTNYLPLSGGTITGTLTIYPTNTSAWLKGLVLYDSGGGHGEASWIEWTSGNYSNGVRLVGAPDDKALYFWDTNSWKTIYHTGNLPAYPTKASWNYDDVYVKSVSISGNNLRINKNGTDSDLTIPYATSAGVATGITNGFKRFEFNAGKTYIGWVSIASLQLNTYNHYDYNAFNLYICRGYNAPSSESYAINITIGWAKATLRLIGKSVGTQIISKCRIAIDTTNHVLYLQVYVKTAYTTYQNGCSATLVGIINNNWTVVNAVNDSLTNVAELDLTAGIQADYATSAGSVAWENVSSKPDTATRWPAWSEVTGKPDTFTPSSHDHNMNDIKWPGGHNLITSATANGQEWSVDCTPGSYTGTYWQVWRATTSGISTSGTMLKVDCDTGKVSAPYGFVGNLEGNASTATKLATSCTIWGQSFDGSANIIGDMSNVGSISFSDTGKNIGSIAYFDTANSRLGIGASSPETKFDVNGIQQIYHRGLDNTAFKNLLLLKAQNSTEPSGDNWAATNPTFGIGFRRYWTTSSNNPYGETTCAGIYATVSGSWRGGLVFRTKNNTTSGGTHDTTALRLAPSGAASFASTVTATSFVGNLTGNVTGTATGNVTALSINNNYLRWTKNGSDSDLTIPYATYSGYAPQLSQTSISSLSSFTHSTNLIYSAANGSNSVSDKPTGVDAFGVISYKTADGWYGQLLTSSNTSSGLYWRTATSLSGGWRKVLDSDNSSVSKSEETLSVKINDTTQSLTNTWRGIQDNLTSDSNTTESLSAKQGYLLANGSARDNTKLPLSGGTMTGLLKINYGIATDEWASNDGAISIRNTSNDNPYTLGFAANNGGYGEIQASQIGVDAVNLVLLKKGGNVGIATTTPQYKLDVRGDIYSSGYIRTGSGFIKRNLSDSYVLLAGGGHASLTNLQVSGTATSVTSLNVEKTFIYATLTESATLGLSAAMSVGQVLTILAFNNGSASITLTVPSAWKSLDGYSINIGALRFGEISILCYASGSFMVSSKVQ